MAEKKPGISTKKPTVKDDLADQIISNAAADNVPGITPRPAPATTGHRGRPPAEDPRKGMLFNLPIRYFNLIQQAADESFNASPGKGNKSEYVQRLIEADLKKRGLL